MGLESLLARLEGPREGGPAAGTRGGVPGKPLQNKPGTPNTPRTPEIQQGWPDIISKAAIVNLDEVLAAACESVAGITPAQFRALLSPEDIKDIAAGDLPVETLRAYTESFAEGLRSGRIVVPGGEP